MGAAKHKGPGDATPLVPRRFLEAEAQTYRGIEVVAREVAVRQTAIYLREHEPDICIELLGKLPIESSRYRVERTGALRVCAEIGAARAGECVLGVVIVGTNHVQAGSARRNAVGRAWSAARPRPD